MNVHRIISFLLELVTRARLNLFLFLPLQFVFVFLAVMLLPNQTLGKSFVSQEQEQKDKNFAEEELEGHHAVNGMSVIRGKRALSDYLKDYCVPPREKVYSSPEVCVEARYFCEGHAEAVCAEDTYSTTCTGNVAKNHFPKCFPKYKWVNITTPQGIKEVRWTKSCSCTE